MQPNPDEDLPGIDRDEVVAQIPVAETAWQFLHAFYGGNLTEAWQLLDPTLRLCWAQWWVQANDASLRANVRDPEAEINSLAAATDGDHDLWRDFSRVTCTK